MGDRVAAQAAEEGFVEEPEAEPAYETEPSSGPPSPSAGAYEMFSRLRYTGLIDMEIRIVIRKVLMEMTHKEIAEDVGVAVTTVGRVYQNAIQKLADNPNIRNYLE